MGETTGTDLMLLSQKRRAFSGIFIAFSESTRNYSRFEKKISFIA